MARRKRDTFRQKKGLFSRGGIGRRILVWLLLLTGGLLVLAILGYYQLVACLQGESFRETCSESLKNKVQAEELQLGGTLTLSGNRLSLPGASLHRRDFWHRVSARRISTEFDRAGLLDRKLNLSKLSMEEVHVTLDADRLGEPLPPILPEQGGFWSRFTPRTVNLRTFECRDADITLRRKSESYHLSGCSISSAPKDRLGRHVWQINLENGRLHTPLSYLRDCGVRTATLLADPKELNLTECRLMLTPGELRIRGYYEWGTRRWRTTLRANKANVARLLSEDWKKRLTGELFGELELVGSGRRLQRGAGILALQQGELEGLPFLSNLPFNGGKPYRCLKLEKAECRMSYPYNEPEHNIREAWLIDNIDIRSENGTLLVRGHVIIAPDGSLRGVLNVGLPENIISLQPLYQSDLMKNLFTREGERGYLWLHVNISGTVDEPREDLSVRLSTLLSSSLLSSSLPEAAVQSLRQWVPGLQAPSRDSLPAEQGNPEPKPDAPVSTPESTPTAPEQLLEDAADAAGGILNSGLRALF